MPSCISQGEKTKIFYMQWLSPTLTLRRTRAEEKQKKIGKPQVCNSVNQSGYNINPKLKHNPNAKTYEHNDTK